MNESPPMSEAYLPMPFHSSSSSGQSPAQGPRGWHHMWAKQGVVPWKPAGHATELR